MSFENISASYDKSYYLPEINQIELKKKINKIKYANTKWLKNSNTFITKEY